LSRNVDGWREVANDAARLRLAKLVDLRIQASGARSFVLQQTLKQFL
jgi:hypothetical protein